MWCGDECIYMAKVRDISSATVSPMSSHGTRIPKDHSAEVCRRGHEEGGEWKGRGRAEVVGFPPSHSIPMPHPRSHQ
jgi:hypothetical protein